MLSKQNVLAALAISTACLLSTHAFAGNNAPYFGLQMGSAKNHFGSEVQTGANTAFSTAYIQSNTGVAGRLFAGYQLGPNLAIETGFTRFSNATYNSDLYNNHTHISIKTYALDLVGKVIVPVTNGFSIYGKGGVAYQNVNSQSNATDSNGIFVSSNSANEKTDAFLPTFGLGVSYDLTQNVAADLSWTRLQKTGSTSKIGNTDFIGLGLKYSIS